jgi:hypothetical protein
VFRACMRAPLASACEISRKETLERQRTPLQREIVLSGLPGVDPKAGAGDITYGAA